MIRIAKISLCLLMILCISFCINVKTYAAENDKVITGTPIEAKPGEEFSVTFSLTNLNTEIGYNSLMGTLVYDDDSLEMLNLTSLNGWSDPFYFQGAFILDNNEHIKDDSAFLKVDFKVKDDAPEKTANIKIVDLTVSNADNEVRIGTISNDVIISTATNEPTPPPSYDPTPDDDNSGDDVNPGTTPGEEPSTPDDNGNVNQGDNNPSSGEPSSNKPAAQNPSNKSNNSQGNDGKATPQNGTTYKGKLPQTGDIEVLFFSLGLFFSIISAVMFVKMKNEE